MQTKTKNLYQKAKLENIETEKYIKNSYSNYQQKVHQIIDATLQTSDNVIDVDQYNGKLLK